MAVANGTDGSVGVAADAGMYCCSGSRYGSLPPTQFLGSVTSGRTIAGLTGSSPPAGSSCDKMVLAVLYQTS